MTIGVINLTNYDKQTNSAEFGYYVKPGLHGYGYRFVSESINFIFKTLRLNAIRLSVMEDNLKAIALDRRIGMILDKEKTIEGKNYLYTDSFLNPIYRDSKQISNNMIKVDKQKTYVSNGWTFKNFVMLSDDEVRDVWQWRNDESIRKWMYNSDIIPWENHLKFIESLRNRDDKYYWLVSDTGGVIGVIDLITNEKYKLELRNYMTPGNEGNGFDFFKECFYFVFHTLNVDSLYTAVNKKNKPALYLNQFLGQKFDEEKTEEENGNKEEYYVCNSYTKKDFDVNYNKTIVDYAIYVKSLRKAR